MAHACQLRTGVFTAAGVLALLVLLASPCVARPSSKSSYYILPVDVRHGAIRSRGRNLLEAGKLDIDGSVRIGYFYAVLHLGTPPKPFHAIVDTGSTVTYVPCYDCAHCGRHDDAPFNPSQSPSARFLSCKDSQCSKQASVYFCDSDDLSFDQQPDPNAQCRYRISYAERSSSEGRLVQDLFIFPNNATRVPITFGCESGESGEIYKQRPDGILGMGNNPGAFHSQLASAGAIPHIFSLCFGFPTGGALLLGDAPVPSNPTYSWTALSASGWGDFFAVSVDHITYGDSRLAVPQAAFDSGYRTVLDSGTTFIYLTSPAYKAFAAATLSAGRTAGLQQTTDGYGDICWDGAPPDFAGLDKMFPDAVIQFVGGGRLRLPAYRYMFQLSRKGTYCMAVFDNGAAGSLIGGVATRNVLVQYDLESKRVGFADVDCNAMGQMPASMFNAAPAAAAAATPVVTEAAANKPAGPAAQLAAPAGGTAAAQPVAAAPAAAAAGAASAAPKGTSGIQLQEVTAAAAVPAPAATPTSASAAEQHQQEQKPAATPAPVPTEQQQQKPASLHATELQKELDIIGKAEEVYDEAYDQVLSIMDKAQEKVKDIIITVKSAAETTATGSSAGTSAGSPSPSPSPSPAAGIAAAGAASAAAAAAGSAGQAAGTSAVAVPAPDPAVAAQQQQQQEAESDSPAGPLALPSEVVSSTSPVAGTAAVAAKPQEQQASAAAPAAAAAPGAAGTASATKAQLHGQVLGANSGANSDGNSSFQPMTHPASATELTGNASATTTYVPKPLDTRTTAAPASTAAVSESLLEPSSTPAAGSSSSSASGSADDAAATAAAAASPKPAKVYWGTSNPPQQQQQSGTGDMQTGWKGLGGSASSILVLVALVLLLAAAGAVALAVRRRAIKAAGFSQISAADIDCELAGISRLNPNPDSSSDSNLKLSLNGLGSSGGGRFSGSNGSSGSSRGGGGSAVQAAAASRAVAGAAGSGSVQHGDITLNGLQDLHNLDLDAAAAAQGSGAVSHDWDAIKSPARDQLSPKPAFAAGVGGGAAAAGGSSGSLPGLLPPPRQSGGAPPLLQPPPAPVRQRMDAAAVVAAAAADAGGSGGSDVVAAFSLDQDQDQGLAGAQRAAAAAAPGGAGGASAGGSGTEGFASALSSDSMELISLEDDLRK